MKSIKSKLIVFFGTMLICISFANIYLSAYSTDKILRNSEEIKLTSVSEKSAEIVNNKCKDRIETLKSISRRSEFKLYDLRSEEIQQMLNNEAKECGFRNVFISDTNGNMTMTSGAVLNVSTDPIFIAALKGQCKISNPMSSGTSDLVNVSAPVYDSNNTIIGVLIGTQDFVTFSESIIDSKYTSFIISKDGDLVAHSEEEMLDETARIDNPQNDAIKEKMKNGENGYGDWILETNNSPQFIGYNHIDSTDWSIGILQSKKDVLGNLLNQLITNTVIAVIFLVIGLFLVYIYARKTSNNIKELSNHLNVISKGNFSVAISDKLTKIKDEIGDSANAIEIMRKSLGSMISTVKESTLNMERDSNKLNNVSAEVKENSTGIADATNEMAAGVQDQTTDLMHILETINVFNNKLENIVNKTSEINVRTNIVNDQVKKGNTNAINLGQSVSDVNETFKEFTNKINNLTANIAQITDITMLINSIAEQTNLLALNASIEAARAGDAGKGFAVVAEEIRTLAEQCKDSAENIDQLIKNVSDEAGIISSSTSELDSELNDQIAIIDSTVDSFKEITDNVREIAEHLGNITEAVTEINKDKNDILSKVESSTAVGEEISASTEEIAASTDNMKSSADHLEEASKNLLDLSNTVNEQINKFQI